jgi:hypothetical protein
VTLTGALLICDLLLEMVHESRQATAIAWCRPVRTSMVRGDSVTVGL